MILMLDYGHGGRAQGCMRPPWCEAKDVLEIGQLARDAIAGAGWPVTVYETRHDNLTTVPLATRAVLASDVNADLVISLHVDESPDAREHGPIAFMMPTAGELERIVCSQYLVSLGRSSVVYDARGVRHDLTPGSSGQHAEASPDVASWRHRAWEVLHYHTRPAVLFEQGRCSNADELAWLQSQEGKAVRIEALRTAVCAALVWRGEITEVT